MIASLMTVLERKSCMKTHQDWMSASLNQTSSKSFFGEISYEMVYHNGCTFTNYVNQMKYFMKRNLLMSVDFDIMGGCQALK